MLSLRIAVRFLRTSPVQSGLIAAVMSHVSEAGGLKQE